MMLAPTAKTRRHLGILAILVLAFLVRAAVVSWVGWNSVTFGDARDYLNTATHLCVSGEYPDRGNLPFFRAPGLPLMIAVGTLCHPADIWLIKLELIAIDVLGVLALFALARVVLMAEAPAHLAALAAAINPFFVAQVADVRSEPLFMLFMDAALLCFFMAQRRGWPASMATLALSGCSLALAALTRPSALIGIPFFAIAWFAGGRFNRQRVAGVVIFVVSAGAVMTPWVVRNAVATGELILVNDAGGYNVWRGTHPELQRLLGSATRDQYRARVRHFQTYTQARAAAKVDARASSPRERSHEWLRLALDRMREHPEEEIAILGANLARYWRPWLSSLEHSRIAVVLSAAWLLPLFVLGAAGLILLLRRDRQTATIVGAWLIVTWLAHAPFQVVMRFRISYADPVLLILASLALTELCRGPGPESRLESEARGGWRPELS
ncbi:MAG: hypothetical protein GXP47_13535 [Acidobacteria bacterium]|nr:hypothetical protein [Acidobacteriota bacterium]